MHLLLFVADRYYLTLIKYYKMMDMDK